MKEAMFYKKINNLVQCQLCPRNCKIAENGIGFCKVRKNINGKLFSLVYGKPCSVAIDPIEKKPLFHFAPGSSAFSVATVGCNFSCRFCQNWSISQPKEIFGKDLPPDELIDEAISSRVDGFSWTYTEPTVFYEYFYDTAMLCKKRKENFYHMWVTNGYTNPEAIAKAKFLHAVNVDYKGDKNFYLKLCGAVKMEAVQEALIAYKKAKIWIEVTNLIIPNWNDKDSQIKELCEWLHDNLGQIPLHFSRYFPAYLMREPATPMQTLEKAAEIADNYFDFVYIGNIPNQRENTYCPNCKTLLIERRGFFVVSSHLKKKNKSYHCPDCNRKIPLAGMQWSRLQQKEIEKY